MRLSIISCLLVLMPSVAMAAGLDDFVAARGGAMSCWARNYDAAHLATHPDQLVTAMAFGVEYQQATAEYGENYGFHLKATLRGGTEGMASGPCYPEEGKMRCGVECDGGGVLVSKRADGSILLDLQSQGYIRMTDSCGAEEEGGFNLESGKDDRSFLLHPVSAKVCRALMGN